MATHVQKALRLRIYDLLVADATLATYVSTLIYSSAPDNTVYPRVKIGAQTLEDWSTHTTNGFQGDVFIHAWAQGTSDVEIMNIMNSIYAVLHAITDLQISGYSTVNFRCVLNEILPEPDGRTYQGVQRYSIMLGGD